MKDFQGQLLNGLLTGDKKQIRIIYDQLFPKVRQFILRNNGNQQDAEDIFQKSLLQLITRLKLREVSEVKSIEAYLFTINKNLWRRELNKNERVTKSVLREQDSESTRLEGNTSNEINVKAYEEEAIELLEQERWELYRNCFERLSENCRKILEFFFKKKPYSEFNSEFGYSSESVARQRVFKCKNKLSELIKSHADYKRLKNL
ncbi:MAG: sigma-70 family RNA polymerase sigma factor [Cyclobacteriaceae bacterium]